MITYYALSEIAIPGHIQFPGLWRVDIRTKQSNTNTDPIYTGTLSIPSW